VLARFPSDPKKVAPVREVVAKFQSRISHDP
jgi:hypothetical protein